MEIPFFDKADVEVGKLIINEQTYRILKLTGLKFLVEYEPIEEETKAACYLV